MQWTEAFCSARTATIQVNGQTSEVRDLPQAKLPQESALSPILFLFFNADLVQQRTWLVVVSEAIAVIVIAGLDGWIVRPTSLEDEAVAMLHAMSFERIIGFFIWVVEQVRRGGYIFHSRTRKKIDKPHLKLLCAWPVKTRRCRDYFVLTDYTLSLVGRLIPASTSVADKSHLGDKSRQPWFCVTINV